MKTDTDAIVARYLKELERALGDVPKARRREIVAEIREHIEESIAGSGAETEAEIRNVLGQVGEPETIAAEARADLGIEKRRGGLLEGSAIALLLVGGLAIPGIGWIVGAVLLWVSRVWSTKDKLIGTFLVPGGLAPAAFFGLFATGSSASCEVQVSSSSQGSSICSTGTVSPEIWGTLLLVVLVIAPIATAVYLGRRAWTTPRR